MANRTVWLASQAGRCKDVVESAPELLDRITLLRALRVAVANDHADVVRVLLRAGANVAGGRAFCARTPLDEAAQYDSAHAMRALIEAKACIHVNGEPVPACWAAWYGSTRTMHMLLKSKASVDAVCWDGRTLVLLAAQNGDVGMLHMLLRAKADATLCTHEANLSPLFVVAAKGHAAAARCLLAHDRKLVAISTTAMVQYVAHSYVAHSSTVPTHGTAQDIVPDEAPIYVPAGSTPLDVARIMQQDVVVSLLMAASAGQSLKGAVRFSL